MQHITTKLLLLALCISALSTGLLGMETNFVGQIQKIAYKQNIDQKLDVLHEQLVQEESESLQRFKMGDQSRMVQVYTTLMDIQEVRRAQNTLNPILARERDVEKVAEIMREFIFSRCDTDKPAIGALLDIFANPALSAENR
jgi:hypothetical protein